LFAHRVPIRDVPARRQSHRSKSTARPNPSTQRF
jgi:deoxyribodipyrimidine photo-lyase